MTAAFKARSPSVDERAAKADGLAIIEETSHHCKILVVFDSLKGWPRDSRPRQET